MYVSALDVSKAFDNVNHYKLLTSLLKAGFPGWIVRLLVNWYDKLVVSVHWQGSLSDPLIVQSDVRQGSSLSPAIFNIFINAFIVKLHETNSGCYINGEFVGCVMYADDIILISASVNGLQTLLNGCHTVRLDLLLKFNCVKSTCIAIGLRSSFTISNMQLGDDFISWSNKLKYLGVMFNVAKTLSIDVNLIRRKFFAACNCLLGNSIHQNEILKLCLQESYALPVLQHACSAINFTKSQLNDLNVCWHFVYRRIFGFCKSEPLFYSWVRQTRLFACSLIADFKIYKMCSVYF